MSLHWEALLCVRVCVMALVLAPASSLIYVCLCVGDGSQSLSSIEAYFFGIIYVHCTTPFYFTNSDLYIGMYLFTLKQWLIVDNFDRDIDLTIWEKKNKRQQ